MFCLALVIFARRVHHDRTLAVQERKHPTQMKTSHQHDGDDRHPTHQYAYTHIVLASAMFLTVVKYMGLLLTLLDPNHLDDEDTTGHVVQHVFSSGGAESVPDRQCSVSLTWQTLWALNFFFEFFFFFLKQKVNDEFVLRPLCSCGRSVADVAGGETVRHRSVQRARTYVDVVAA